MNAAPNPIRPATGRGVPLAGISPGASAGLGLETYSEAGRMRVLLQARLPEFAEGRLRIDSLAVASVRRNASIRRNPCRLAVCYALQVSDPQRARTGAQILYGKVFRPGLAAACYRQQHRGRLVQPAFGRPLVHLPEFDMVIWALPNDPALPQLPMLLDPERAASVMPWGAPRVAGGQSGAVHVELLRYEPEDRATLRYTVAGPAGEDPCALYAKTFADDRAREVHDRFAFFWRLARADRSAPLVAQPLACGEATHTVWYAAARGRPLLDALESGTAEELMGQVARALATLHGVPLAPPAGASPRSTAHWVTEARRRQEKIGRAYPAVADRAARVADALAAHASRETTRPLGLIHGDFHPGQTWVHEGRIVLFDFDEFALGDPMEDLASFVVKLEQSCALPRLSSALVGAYAACAPGRFDRRSLAWHLALQSLLQASRAFVFQRPGWMAELERRLALAERRAAALSAGAA